MSQFIQHKTTLHFDKFQVSYLEKLMRKHFLQLLTFLKKCLNTAQV